MKLNNADHYESIMVQLSETKHPVTFANAVKCLTLSGMSKEEAEQTVRTTPYEMEMYYEVGVGLFLVDCGAVESGTVYSPYSGQLCEVADVEV